MKSTKLWMETFRSLRGAVGDYEDCSMVGVRVGRYWAEMKKWFGYGKWITLTDMVTTSGFGDVSGKFLGKLSFHL